MKYVLTHCCENESLEPKIFDDKQSALNAMIQKVRDIAVANLQNEWINEDLPKDAQKTYERLVETGHVIQENELKIQCFDFDVLEIFPVEG